MADLSEKQKRFYREWLIDYNGAQAAIRAGYSRNGADVQGCRLLGNAKGLKYLEKLKKKVNDRVDFTREDVIKELGKIGFSDVREIFNSDGSLKCVKTLSDKTSAAVEFVEVVTKSVRGARGEAEVEHTHKIKLSSKISALKELGKHFNIYEDHQKSGADEMTVVFSGKFEGV